MNILIVGCGQVGLHLVRQLEEAGHEVSVLDEHAENLRQLSSQEGRPFTGVAMVGMPIDVDVLRQAGIEACDAVAAVSDDDRINIMAAQIARDVFGVAQVVARIADPRLEHIYASRFGLMTICPTRLTVSAALDALTRLTDGAALDALTKATADAGRTAKKSGAQGKKAGRKTT